LLAFARAPQAQAGTVTLTDQNSTVLIDPTSQAGAYAWIVDGTNNLYQQWFWYRIGNNPTGQSSIDTISAPSVSLLGTDIAKINYSNASLGVQVTYTLTGGSVGSGISDLAETVRLTNNSKSALSLHFFQYSDFDLAGSSGGDSVTLTNSKATQTKGGASISETVVVPDASRLEANYYANTLNSLNSGALYNLNNVASAGPGDVTWAYQWDTTIAAGGSYIISKDKHLENASIPEPSSLVLASFAGLGLIGLKYCRRSRKC